MHRPREACTVEPGAEPDLLVRSRTGVPSRSCALDGHPARSYAMCPMADTAVTLEWYEASSGPDGGDLTAAPEAHDAWDATTGDIGISAVLLVGACGPTPTASVPPSTAAGQASEGTASEPTAPAASPATESTAKPSSKPSPSAKPAPAVWSKPRVVRKGGCSDLVATIDPSSGYHVAAVCKDRIVYLTSTDGTAWKQTTLDPPAHPFDVHPQLAVDGDTVYLAYNRLAPEKLDGGCGGYDNGGVRDVGVYTRSRHLPDGAWSKPAKIGRTGDSLKAFRAVDGVLHLIVSDGAVGQAYYESRSGEELTRIEIPGALTASLRVGDDGHARIAYSSYAGIRYARVGDGRLSIKTVTNPKRMYLIDPSLVLGAGDDAYVVWTQIAYPDDMDTCGGDQYGSRDGTYVGTDTSGHWTSTRITRAIGDTAFTVDPSTGRLHALVDTGSMTYYTGIAGKHMTPKKLAGTKGMSDAVIRLDARSGKVVVFARKGNKGIYVMSKP